MVQVPLQIVEEAGRGAVKHCAGGKGIVGIEPGHSCDGMGRTGQHPPAADRIQTFCFVFLYCFVLLNKNLYFALSLSCTT